MSTENLPVKSEFQIMDEADSQQIQDAETAVKQALVYEVRGKKQLSYMGVKWLVLKMSQKEQPIEVIDMPLIELVKHEPDNKSTWIWYATIKVRNRKTGLSTVGASESPYSLNGTYDTFGRTKSLSKAERNACRKQIPEVEINAMLNSINNEDIQKLNTPNTQNTDAPTLKQLDYLQSLGYTGIIPNTKQTASNIIEDLKNDAKSAEPVKDKNWCNCEKPKPKFEKEQDGKHYCYDCKNPVKSDQASKLLNIEVNY